MPHVLTLTTDFGTRDWFVATMKGVISGVVRDAQVIDVTHEVAPGDVRGGAFALAAATPYFPPGTVHIAVIDPGVGGARRPIAVRAGRAILVGPDNGVLSWALRNEPSFEARVLEREAWFLHPVSRTFHGRDVFAPVAARLAAGAPFADVGPDAGEIIRLPWPELAAEDRKTRGSILHIDRFGNAITNIPGEVLPAGSNGAEVELPDGSHAPVVGFYSAVSSGASAAVVASAGFLEIAVNGGSAAEMLALRVGDPVTVAW